ncbi:hypothetical protein MIZ03_0101 [Rhodoferax lithotrophicus]|uniref:Uncharacterized protein n=1 Tax=Rhodoferax lithotrophicus TaxID=2798804 RepID=A0ABN6CZQ2_9BURK|nr:hypothetical protein MIZ03_0101 [Rhodoferax sp. MIZ03]
MVYMDAIQGNVVSFSPAQWATIETIATHGVELICTVRQIAPPR